MKNIITDIFSDYTPGNFGLCGEVYLWEEFRSHFLELPEINTEEEFTKELKIVFENLTGVSVESSTFVFVKRYNRGGISSGMVDPWNWSAVIFPMMLERFKKRKGTFS